MRKRTATAPRRAPVARTPYEQGVYDAQHGRQRPGRTYATSDALVLWWEGWQAGKRQGTPLEAAGAIPARPVVQPWEERRAAYLRAKARARDGNVA